MTDVTDVQSYENTYKSQLEKLATAEINEPDREAISNFVRHVDANGEIKKGAIINHVNRLRLSAERWDQPLVEATGDDSLDSIRFILKHDYGLKTGTLRNYEKAWRKFFRWRGVEWANDISIRPCPDRNVDPTKLLTEDEIDEMLETANHVRDKATLALLSDTGMRIGAIASLRVRDVDFSGRVATVSINEDGNVKDASGSVPLTWCRGYIANWLDVHPRSDDRNAALIHKLRNFDDDEDGALTYHYLSRRIKKIGQEAGIDRERLNTHNFRKSAISRWIREGLDEQTIKHRAHWAKDSAQFSVYSGVTDEEMNEKIAAEYGIIDEEDAERPGLNRCPQCQTPLRKNSRFCPGCGAPLTANAAETMEQVVDDTITTIAIADDEKIERAVEFREMFKNDPELRQALLNK